MAHAHATYTVNLATLPAQGAQMAYKADTAFFQSMEQPDIQGASVEVHACVKPVSGMGFTLEMTLQGILCVACDRCLEPMELSIDLTHHYTIALGPEPDLEGDGHITVDELRPTLDLAPLICDAAMLAIPMRHVHPDGACDPAMTTLLKEHGADTVSDTE